MTEERGPEGWDPLLLTALSVKNCKHGGDRTCLI